MKKDNPAVGVKVLCGLFGKTRHAFYDQQWRREEVLLRDDLTLHLVMEIRETMPRIGTRKLHFLLQEKLCAHQLSIGRDHLFDLLQNHGLLVRSRKRKAVTTDSRHWMRKYPNLTIGLFLNRSEQLWVSDITYIRLINGFIYLSLITDAYSRKIVGYHLQKDLSAEGCMRALEMALQGRLVPHQPLIHHSDRGSQYCSKPYVELLGQHGILISMTQNGDPYENALAERINGILKHEFNLYASQTSFEQTKLKVEQSINAYNQYRPHASCDYLTPQCAHQQQGPLKKRWKNYNPKKIDQNDNFQKNNPV